MKAVIAEKIDSIDDYQLCERPDPEIGKDEVLIQVHVCGMGYVDALVAIGGYQVKPEVPFTPGQEISGKVVSVGDEVSHLRRGDRVVTMAFGGGLSELVAMSATRVFKIPPNMTFAQAASFRLNYITALHALKNRANLRPNERLLVFGAAGGVGSAAVQLGKLMQAEVIAVASTEEKRAFAKSLGADHCLDTSVEGWRDRLKSEFGEKAVDVVFDPVCGPLFEAAFRSLKWNGRHLVVGFTGGPIPKLPINLTIMKGAALIGVDVRQLFVYEPQLGQSLGDDLMSWVEEGRLSPPVGRVFEFAEFAEAMEFAMSGKGLAKTLIRISNDA